MSEVTVISLTRNRPNLLPRAIKSVASQTVAASIHHLIVVDDCSETRDLLETNAWPPNLSWVTIPRVANDVSGPGRAAVLRNIGVRRAESPWISFLDDDNEFETDHIESLIDLAKGTGRRAVHSWLRMYHSDGSPYLVEQDPWTRDPEYAHEKYLEMVSKGVRTPGSNVFQDRADCFQTAAPVLSVDTGEWLLSRQLLLEIPIPEAYTPDDWRQMRTEDDKFLEVLANSGEAVACTMKPTLRYYLGGYSNNFSRA